MKISGLKIFTATLLACCITMNANAAQIMLFIHAPQARSVSVAGSFDLWWKKLHPMARDAQGYWQVKLELPSGRYELQFLVDGQWRYNPDFKQVDDGLGGINNVIVVP